MAFALLTVFLSVTPVVFAESPESFGLTPESTLPGSSGYGFKRLGEKIGLFFKFSKSAKYSYGKELLEKRVSEYVSLVENKNQNEIADGSQRLAYQAGILAETAGKSSEKSGEVIALFEKYKPILAKMRDNFPANTPFWLLSQQDIDTMNILTDKIK